MSLITPEDSAEIARQRDRMLADAADQMQDAADLAMQQLLRNMRGAIRRQAGLTASIELPRMTSDFMTLGQVNGWWDEALDEHVVAQVLALWTAGRASGTDAVLSARSLDAAGDYLAIVKDRLSRTAQPTLPEEAFNTVRRALTDELARGSSTRAITDRLGAELQWQGQDVGYWRNVRETTAGRIEQLLDQAGPQFTLDPDGNRIENPARRDLRLNDPTIRDLQAQVTEADARIRRDRSEWQVRAERIARTETTGAYNAGAMQAYAEEQAAVKTWLCAPDDRTRDAHLEANGQVVAVSEPFDVGGELLMYPGDPSGSPGNVINCRCTTIAGTDPTQLRDVAMPAIEQVDFERAVREDRAREIARAELLGELSTG